MNGHVQQAQIFKALAEPVRLDILAMLAQSERCACNLLEQLSISQPTLSHHMKILVRTGLVQSRKNATWTYYALHQESLATLKSFITSLEQGPATPTVFPCSPRKTAADTCTSKRSP